MIMELLKALMIGVISGLGMGIVLHWGIIKLFRLRNATTAQKYEKCLSNDRCYAKKTFTSHRRIYWAPAIEELVCRAAPIALWFIGKTFWAKIMSLIIMLGISTLWAVIHTWEHYSCRVRSYRPHWSSRRLRQMHNVTMLMQAGAYMGSFLIGAALARQSMVRMASILRIATFLGIGWMSATCVHGLHNYLLFAENRWGQTYRCWRLVSDSDAKVKQPCSPSETLGE